MNFVKKLDPIMMQDVWDANGFKIYVSADGLYIRGSSDVINKNEDLQDLAKAISAAWKLYEERRPKIVVAQAVPGNLEKKDPA